MADNQTAVAGVRCLELLRQPATFSLEENRMTIKPATIFPGAPRPEKQLVQKTIKWSHTKYEQLAAEAADLNMPFGEYIKRMVDIGRDVKLKLMAELYEEHIRNLSTGEDSDGMT